MRRILIQIFLLASPALLTAQMPNALEPPVLPVPQAENPTGEERCAGAAYLNTSFEAQEALKRADLHVRRGNWAAAASAYQDIAKKHSDSLIRFGPDRYVSIRKYVNAAIAAWPPAGLAAYRAAFETVAERKRAELDAALDADALASLAEEYWPTRTAAEALDAAAELAMERGDFSSARQCYTNLLSNHPSRTDWSPLWSAKRALCDAWLGNAAPLQILSREFTPEKPGPMIRWGGRARTLRAFLADALEQFEAARDRRSASADVALPSIFCGDARRNAYFRTTALAEARLWRSANPILPKTESATDRIDFNLSRRNAFLRSLQSGRLIAASPVVGNGLVFTHNNHSVLATDPERPNEPVWQYRVSPTRPPEPQWISEDEPPQQFTSLFADGRLYAHLQRNLADAQGNTAHKASALVCLNAATGDLIWQANLDRVASKFEDIRLDGAPLLHRGRLFAVARRRKAFGFEACLLLCLDPDSGSLLWQTHVGEAPTGSYGYYRPTRTHPAADGDFIFLHTNLGTVAAVSAASGRVEWLTCYASRLANQSEGAWPARLGRPIRSWQYQPTIIWRDAILCAPLDTEELLILDQADGSIRLRLPLEELLNAESFPGLKGDTLYAVGTHIVAYNLADNSITWRRPLPDGQLFGRSALTSNGIFVPTTHALLRFPLDGGPAGRYPWKLEEAGNILPLDDQIVVASAESLYGLVSKKNAFARLTLRMEQQSKDHKAALALAELAFGTRELDRGLDAVERAVSRLGGFARIQDQSTRKKLFDRLLRFAHSLMQAPDQSEPANPQAMRVAAELLRMAGQCAPDLNGQVVYRLFLARALLQDGNAEDAVLTYQHVIEDKSLRKQRLHLLPEHFPPSLRTTPDIAETQSKTNIGILVAEWIDRLIADHGRSIYDPVEQQAENRLAVAKTDADPGAVLEVADAFPNSRTAANALIAHARLTADRRDWTQALRSYRRAIAKLDYQERPAILREFILRLADADEKAQADQWLERARRDHPAYRFEYNDQLVGFDQLRRLILGDRRFQSIAYPTLSLPLTETQRRVFTDRAIVLNPVFRRLPATRWDSYLTFSNGRLDARVSATGQHAWPRSIERPTQPILLGMDDDRFVFATAHSIFALTRTQGSLVWQFGEEPPDDAHADPETFTAWTDHVMTEDRLFAASDRGDIVCLDLADGNLRWRSTTDGGPANRLTAVRDRLCYALWKGRHNLIQIMDADSGERVAELRTDETRPVQALAATPDGGLLAVRSRTIVCIQLDTGAIRWRIATPELFVISTLNVGPEGLFISDDGRTIAQYDLYNGQKMWSTPPIGDDAGQGLWAELVGGRLLAASKGALVAFDAAGGRSLWIAENPSGLRVQAPILTSDAVITISPETPKPTADDPQAVPDRRNNPLHTYTIRAFRIRDGAELSIRPEGPFVTRPIDSFGGLFVRDRCLLLLDGKRLMGYVAP